MDKILGLNISLVEGDNKVTSSGDNTRRKAQFRNKEALSTIRGSINNWRKTRQSQGSVEATSQIKQPVSKDVSSLKNQIKAANIDDRVLTHGVRPIKVKNVMFNGMKVKSACISYGSGTDERKPSDYIDRIIAAGRDGLSNLKESIRPEEVETFKNPADDLVEPSVASNFDKPNDNDLGLNTSSVEMFRKPDKADLVEPSGTSIFGKPNDNDLDTKRPSAIILPDLRATDNKSHDSEKNLSPWNLDDAVREEVAKLGFEPSPEDMATIRSNVQRQHELEEKLRELRDTGEQLRRISEERAAKVAAAKRAIVQRAVKEMGDSAQKIEGTVADIGETNEELQRAIAASDEFLAQHSDDISNGMRK